MKLLALCLLMSFSALCQPSATVTSGRVNTASGTLPGIESKKLIDLTKSWITEVQRSGGQFEISNVSDGSFTLSGYKKNAFYYRDRGETHWQDAKLVFNVSYTANAIEIKPTVPEIYNPGGTPITYTLPDYFYDGKLKEGYDGLIPSLEKSINSVITSYYNFIVNYN